MTLIVVAISGDEVACVSDMVASSAPTAGQEPRVISPTIRKALLPAGKQYEARLQRKMFYIADQAYVLISGNAESGLGFVKALREACQQTSINHAIYCEACERCAVGHPNFSYIAVSQLEQKPKVYGSADIQVLDGDDGTRFYFSGSGRVQFREYFRDVLGQFDVEKLGPHPWDFLDTFSTLAQGLQYITGTGAQSRWGSGFERLSNRTGSLELDDNILIHVGVIYRNIDNTIYCTSFDWMSFQSYRDSYIAMISEPKGGTKRFDIVREHPDDRNFRRLSPGERLSVSTLTSAISAWKYDFNTMASINYQTGKFDFLAVQIKRVSVERISMESYGFPLTLVVDPAGSGGIRSTLRDESVWLPRLEHSPT